MKYSEFRADRLMEAYEKYLRGETFKKARAVILEDGKVVMIKDVGKNVVTLPGGGVEENESVIDAAVREAKEEVGYIVEPIMVVGKDSYDVKMKIGDVDFVSTRESFFVLCTVKEKGKAGGLEGEYEKGTKVFLDDIDKLKDLHLSESAIEAVKVFNDANQKS